MLMTKVFARWGCLGLSGLLLALLAACGGGDIVAGDPDVFQRSHPLGSGNGPIAAVALAKAPAPMVRVVEATSFLDWAERAHPELFPLPQANQTVDVWTYRYYAATDIYLGVNLSGDVLGLVGNHSGAYNAFPLGKVDSYGCVVFPEDCAAPTIITPPTDTAVLADNPVYFSVVASSGGAVLGYQWRRNGIDIEGATLDHYSIAATTLADNGTTFSVVVSDGSPPDAVSEPVTLTVRDSTTDLNVLLKMGNCSVCHAVDKKLVGPSWNQIVARYHAQPGADVYLAERIRVGGSGVWGAVPMPSSNNVTTAQATLLARWLVYDLLPPPSTTPPTPSPTGPPTRPYYPRYPRGR